MRRLLVDGEVAPDWREPQYSETEITSKVKSLSLSLIQSLRPGPSLSLSLSASPSLSLSLSLSPILTLTLTPKVKSQGLGPFADAGEVAYLQNVCDGDAREPNPCPSPDTNPGPHLNQATGVIGAGASRSRSIERAAPRPTWSRHSLRCLPSSLTLTLALPEPKPNLTSPDFSRTPTLPLP